MSDKFKTLYCVTATGAINEWIVYAEGEFVITVWGQQGGAQQRTQYKAEPKNTGKKNATTAEEQAVKEAKALWTKQKKQKYFESVDEASSSDAIKPMLAKNYQDHKKKLMWPTTGQAKLDGVRNVSYWLDGGVRLQSRKGEAYNVPHIKAELERVLPKGLVLDGELYAHGVSLQNITALVTKNRPESMKLRYHVYDVVMEGTWPERDKVRRQFFADNPNLEFIIQHDSRECASDEDVLQAEKDFVEMGYEGAIVRAHDGLYKQGHRSDKLLKVKSFQDSEYKIIGWKTGKGKDETTPVFRCVTEAGVEFDVRPMGTLAEREEMLRQAPELIGQYMKCKYFDLTDGGCPHFPIGLGIRHKADM